MIFSSFNYFNYFQLFELETVALKTELFDQFFRLSLDHKGSSDRTFSNRLFHHFIIIKMFYKSEFMTRCTDQYP